MKKIYKLFIATMLMVFVFSITAMADEKTEVYVTISDKDGKFVVTQEKIEVTDIDNDGTLTINDALYAAHEAKYDGGAVAGYATETTQWGLGITKLWGTANGGSYGYVVNNVSAMGLADVVKNGDYVNAYIYTDLTAFSDAYSFFNVNAIDTKEGKEITLTLSANGYDANWSPVVNPVEGATITLNGEATEYKTDANGKVTFTLKKGEYVISATADNQVLVPAVCKASVAEVEVETDTKSEVETETKIDKENDTVKPGDTSNVLPLMAVVLLSSAAVMMISKRRMGYEK